MSKLLGSDFAKGVVATLWAVALLAGLLLASHMEYVDLTTGAVH